MKAYCQFFHESTGYVPGSNPPMFDDKFIRPIEMIGSDGVYILDGRHTLSNMISDCHDRMKKLKNLHKGICGFEIHRASKLFDDGRVIYSTVNKYKGFERIKTNQ